MLGNNDYIEEVFLSSSTSAPSPIMYPGGKSRATPILVPLIQEGLRQAETNELVSPFVGGANVEITLAHQGAQVFASDILPPLVNFWRHALTDANQLANAVERYKARHVNDDEFAKLRDELPRMTEDLEAAAAFYVVNRLSVYGLTCSGTRSPNVELKDSNIDKLRAFSAPGLKVDLLDYKVALQARPSAFA